MNFPRVSPNIEASYHSMSVTFTKSLLSGYRTICYQNMKPVADVLII